MLADAGAWGFVFRDSVINNMREIHFSCNPKIAGLLHEYEYV